MPLFTTLPNALGHLNSLFGGDNWAKCSTVMHPVWLLVACFPWWIGLLFGQRFGGHYFSANTQVTFMIRLDGQILARKEPAMDSCFLIWKKKNPTKSVFKRARLGSKLREVDWGMEKDIILEQRKDKTAFWLQREAGRQGARRYLCSTWLRSKMTADGCRADIMDEQMWRQLSKCSNT